MISGEAMTFEQADALSKLLGFHETIERMGSAEYELPEIRNPKDSDHEIRDPCP